MSQAIPLDHAVTFAEWERDWCHREERYEFVDGIPQMVPSEAGPNVRASWELGHLIERHTGRELLCYPTFDVVFRPAPFHARAPDLIVVRASRAPAGHWVAPSDVLLAVEVHSPSTRAVDRSAKRAEYATHGIPSYLMIDTRSGHPTLTLLTHPMAGDYTHEVRGEAVTLHLDGHTVDIAAADLLR